MLEAPPGEKGTLLNGDPSKWTGSQELPIMLISPADWGWKTTNPWAAEEKGIQPLANGGEWEEPPWRSGRARAQTPHRASPQSLRSRNVASQSARTTGLCWDFPHRPSLGFLTCKTSRVTIAIPPAAGVLQGSSKTTQQHHRPQCGSREAAGAMVPPSSPFPKSHMALQSV